MAVLRIRDPVPFLPLDPGSGIGFSHQQALQGEQKSSNLCESSFKSFADSGMFIPDPNFSLSRIRMKEFKYFNPKNCF
jgi:hypothetical protein